jgi:group I intron endonuclease
MTYIVYCLQNKINGKIYIGKSNRNSRVQDHFRIANGGKEKYGNVFSLVHAAIKKYGEENFIHFILEEFDLADDCLEAEKFWIEYFRTDVNRFGNDYGYNLTAGGDGLFGRKHSVESKNKTSSSMKNYWNSLSKDEKNKIIANHKPFTQLVRELNTGCKINWPDDEDLISLVNKHGFKPLAKILNVSDMAIRGRLARRGLLEKKMPQRGKRYN